MKVTTELQRLVTAVEMALLERREQLNHQAADNEVIIAFARQVMAGQQVEDYHGREPGDIAASLLGSWAFIQHLSPEEPKIRLFNPDYRQHGWQIGNTVVAVLCPNAPFLTDSIRGELNRRNLAIHLINSTVISCVRDDENKLLELLPPRSVAKNADGQHYSEEALISFEIGHCTDQQQLDDIRQDLNDIVKEVMVVVGDFSSMQQCLNQAAEDVLALPEGSRLDKSEIKTFLYWLTHHFTFLGYEYLALSSAEQANSSIKVKSQTGQLGLLKIYPSKGVAELEQALTNRGTMHDACSPIVFSKSSRRSRVHRLSYPDYVLVRAYDESGQICGEHRFLGLFTSPVYTLSPKQIPIVRQKVAAVLDRSSLDPGSHKGKDLAHVLDVFPRDELFQSSVDELYATATSVNQIQERRRIRLYVRPDAAGKFVNCLVYIPRDLYCTELREKIQRLLAESFGSVEEEFSTFFSESVLTRTHFVLRVDPDNKAAVDSTALEEEIIKVTMSWKEYFKQYLVEEFGEERGAQLAGDYGDAFSPGYMDDFEPRMAINDIKTIIALDDPANPHDIDMSLYQKVGADEQSLNFRLYHLDKALSLSDVMPILENLGLRIETEHPYDIKRKDGKQIWVHEFGLTYRLDTEVDFKRVSQDFQEAFLRIWSGDADNDTFNKLILGSNLDWREIAMLRAYARYMKQLQLNFSLEYVAETLANHLSVTQGIVQYFCARFDPQGSGDEHAEEEAVLSALDSVENLTEDRIIRQYLALIKATLRTNYYQLEASGEAKNYFSFKLSPRDIPDVPQPVPMFEIYVYSPRVEGVHLRGGKVARGGLRWSDRLEDYRTEVLGLVKAQQVKNAVIVPTGAKGGFVAKQLPSGDREAMQNEGVACYKTFIRGLLDVTDNLVDGNIQPPINVVKKDEDDSYLVVAADKGTATFSDIANGIAIDYGFWLGDAFASGGSAGYDHKKMGITARGAWVSVQRHFREMGINVQETDFTVVGVGDMGGDVFGNGMLLSRHIQLVCAFNHMHIFVDPNPDAEKSYAERQRLFEMPRSSWDDYNRELMSKGGGIFLRSAKSISLTPEIKARFDIDVDKMTPTEFIHAVLKSPVDLFWNGGIGTYIKSSREQHADVGDKANDALRVDGCELRCKVIGEGGNLGVTQLGRIEFALKGGRSNTDFIDNAAGVDCSDHEVNIKILLNAVVANQDMTEKQRNVLLEQMTDSVSELVLKNNYRQTQAISLAEREALLRGGEYRRLMQNLESAGKLNRQLEFLPADEELLERRAAQQAGLTRPELSVLISYVKSQLKETLMADMLSADSYINQIAETAFPPALIDQYEDEIYQHRLNREIIATQLANDLVNNMGITFIERLQQSTGVSDAEIARAYVIARDVFSMPEIWAEIEALDHKVPSELQMEMMAQLMRLVRRASRWFARNRRGNIHVAEEVKRFRDEVSSLREALPGLISDSQRDQIEADCEAYCEQGVPEKLARLIASTKEVYPFLSIIEAAHSMEAPTEKVGELFFALSEKLDLDWFAQQISDLHIENYWQAMARESYRDDLEWQLRNLTVGAMRHICESGDIDACLDRWMEQQKQLVDRWQLMLAELQATEVPEFAMISVAIRELLDLAQSSKYGEV